MHFYRKYDGSLYCGTWVVYYLKNLFIDGSENKFYYTSMILKMYTWNISNQDIS